MIPCKFKIDEKDRLFIGEKWLSNGHWLLNKQFILDQGIKRLSRVASKALGTYWDYSDNVEFKPPQERKLPDFEKLIPSLDGYKPLMVGLPDRATLSLRSDDKGRSFFQINALVFKTSEFEFGVAARYSGPLLFVGVDQVLVKGPLDQIVLMSGHGESACVVGVIQPLRLT